MVLYHVITETNHSAELGSYRSYGLEAVLPQAGGGTRLAYVADAFSDEAEAVRFAELCNKNELAPEQLRDVIVDYLNK